MTEDDKRRLQVEFARRLAEHLGHVLTDPSDDYGRQLVTSKPLLEQPDGDKVVLNAAVEVVASLQQFQQRDELLRRACVPCGLGQVTFIRAGTNGHVSWKCSCGLLKGSE